MTSEQEPKPQDPQMKQAIVELTATIRAKYPAASFAVRCGIDDPREIWITTTVDLDDPDEVVDLVIDRLLELQIEQGVPVHVLPIHPPERVAETLRQQQSRRGARQRAQIARQPM